MSPDENKALVRRFYAAIGGDDDASAATVDALLHPAYLDHNPAPGLPAGRDGAQWFFAAMRAAFAGWQVVPEALIAEGDKVAARVMVRGRHQGPFMGLAPTGRATAFSGIEILRILDGQIVERWGTYDRLGWLQQLDAIPPPAAPGQTGK